MFDGNGYDGLRRVIDISGDGPNNSGRPLPAARSAALAARLTIHGLPIMNDWTQPFGLPTPHALRPAPYFRQNAIRVPGAFRVTPGELQHGSAAGRDRVGRDV